MATPRPTTKNPRPDLDAHLVKGDVHDIGKNIVGVVLACNDYQIIDLGVMVPCDEILRQAREHKVHMIGLSGLITPSLDEMVHVARSMDAEGFDIPLLIGGATTSSPPHGRKIAAAYHGIVIHVKDTSKGVGVVDRLGRTESRYLSSTSTTDPGRTGRDAFARASSRSSFPTPRPSAPLSTGVGQDADRRSLFLGPQTLRGIPLEDIVPYVDWSPFFLSWELKGKYPRIFTDPELGTKARELFDDAKACCGRSSPTSG